MDSLPEVPPAEELTLELRTRLHQRKIAGLQDHVTILHSRNESLDKRMGHLEGMMALIGFEDVDLKPNPVPPEFWRRIARAVQTTGTTLRTMKPEERRACIKVLRYIKSLNDKDIFPTAIRNENPSIASQAQALATRLPCLLESWPTYRVTQLGRLLLRDPAAISQD